MFLKIIFKLKKLAKKIEILSLQNNLHEILTCWESSESQRMNGSSKNRRDRKRNEKANFPDKCLQREHFLDDTKNGIWGRKIDRYIHG